MIYWKKYDPENPPTLDRRYIICGEDAVGNSPYAFGGELQKFPNGLMWIEIHGNAVVHNVTHYAEINMPGEPEFTTGTEILLNEQTNRMVKKIEFQKGFLESAKRTLTKDEFSKVMDSMTKEG